MAEFFAIDTKVLDLCPGRSPVWAVQGCSHPCSVKMELKDSHCAPGVNHWMPNQAALVFGKRRIKEKYLELIPPFASETPPTDAARSGAISTFNPLTSANGYLDWAAGAVASASRASHIARNASILSRRGPGMCPRGLDWGILKHVGQDFPSDCRSKSSRIVRRPGRT